MAKAKASSRKPLLGLTGITQAFMDNNAFLKKFLAKFLYREQDIEDVAQEAYLRAYSTEQERGEIQQPKAFLFSIAKNLAINKVFMDVQKTETEIGAYTVLSVLLKTFIEAGFEFHQKRDRKTLSYRTKRVFDLMAGEAPTEQMSQYEIYQRMVDNIAGMTDNYALYLAKQISAPS